MKVYAVERGSYSDYGIVALFKTRALAQAAIDSMLDKYGDERIVERSIYEDIPPKVTTYIKECYVGKQPQERVTVTDAWDDYLRSYVGRVTRGLGFGKWNGNYRFWGSDKERVHRAFDDYHAQRIAEREGIA